MKKKILHKLTPYNFNTNLHKRLNSDRYERPRGLKSIFTSWQCQDSCSGSGHRKNSAERLGIVKTSKMKIDKNGRILCLFIPGQNSPSIEHWGPGIKIFDF